jgi:hypothetical protein
MERQLLAKMYFVAVDHHRVVLKYLSRVGAGGKDRWYKVQSQEMQRRFRATGRGCVPRKDVVKRERRQLARVAQQMVYPQTKQFPRRVLVGLSPRSYCHPWPESKYPRERLYR